METWRTLWPLEVAIAAARMVFWAAALGPLAAWAVRRAPGDRVTRVVWGAAALQIAALVLFRLGRIEVGGLLCLALVAGTSGGRGRMPWEGVWLHAIDLFHDPNPPVDSTPSLAPAVRRDIAATLRALALGGRRVAGLISRYLGRSSRARARWLTFAVAGVSAVAVAVARALHDVPLTPNAAAPSRHAWSAVSDAWLAGQFVGAPPLVATTAMAAPIVAVAAWSGVGVLRRIAPRAPYAWGAVAGGLVPAAALLCGHPITPDLALGALLPWSLIGPDGRGRAAWRPLAVGLALLLLHPTGGLLGLNGFLISVFLSSRARAPRVAAASAVGLALGATMLLGGGGFASAALDPAVRVRQMGLASLAAFVGVWLSAIRPLGRRGRAAVHGRALGVALLLGAATTPAPTGASSAMASIVLASLVVFAVAVIASEQIPERSLRPWAAAGALAQALAVVSLALSSAPSGQRSRAATEAVGALIARQQSQIYAAREPAVARGIPRRGSLAHRRHGRVPGRRPRSPPLRDRPGRAPSTGGSRSKRVGPDVGARAVRARSLDRRTGGGNNRSHRRDRRGDAPSAGRRADGRVPRAARLGVKCRRAEACRR